MRSGNAGSKTVRSRLFNARFFTGRRVVARPLQRQPDWQFNNINQADRHAIGPMKVAVNVAMRQFAEVDLANAVAQAPSK
jgi:hypothetical protein